MKKGLFHFSAAFLLCFGAELHAAELKDIHFEQVGEFSELQLLLDQENVVASKFNLSGQNQIVLDLTDVTATDKVVRPFDASEFSGAVVFVSAYKKRGSEKDMRITVNLRDNVRSILERRGSKLVLKIENRYGVFSKSQFEGERNFETQINSSGEEGRVHVPKTDSVEDILDNLTLSGRKKYIGKRISFDVKGASVEDILKMIADSSGFNIIITEEIKKLPPLSLTLTNIPWDQSLDTILGLNSLVAKKNGVILMVTTLEKATAELQREINNKKLSEEQEPLVTKIFPISYATITEMKTILQEYLTPARGKISTDDRTNNLIVKDTAEVIERMRKIVEVLDTQTPQVLIESRIVEVVEEHAKDIGLGNGLTGSYDPVVPVNGRAEDIGPGFIFSTISKGASGSAGTAMGLSIGRFGRLANFDFTLRLLESESKAKIISSPKVITQNKKPATITTVDTTSFSNTIRDENVTEKNFQSQSATMSLQVTPQVTNEGSIIMDINLSKQQLGNRPDEGAPFDTQTRAVQTNVLVENGSTIVIGGVYNFEKRENHQGMVFLKDIPILGWLFRTPYNPTTRKNELIIFLTPRVINQEEAGLSKATEKT